MFSSWLPSLTKDELQTMHELVRMNGISRTAANALLLLRTVFKAWYMTQYLVQTVKNYHAPYQYNGDMTHRMMLHDCAVVTLLLKLFSMIVRLKNMRRNRAKSILSMDWILVALLALEKRKKKQQKKKKGKKKKKMMKKKKKKWK